MIMATLWDSALARVHDILGAKCKVVCVMGGEWKVTHNFQQQKAYEWGLAVALDTTCVGDLGVEAVLWSRLLERNASPQLLHTHFLLKEGWREHASLKLSLEQSVTKQPRLDLKFRSLLPDSDSESLFIPPPGGQFDDQLMNIQTLSAPKDTPCQCWFLP